MRTTLSSKTNSGAASILAVWAGLVLLLSAVLVARLLMDSTSSEGSGAAVAQHETEELPVLGTLPDLEFVEASGDPMAISDLKGKVWVATLFFSHCKASCPMMTSELNRFSEAVNNPDILLVSISIDPERDTPERLREYAELVGADRDRWYFLTGEWETVFELAETHLKLGTGRKRDASILKSAGENAVAGLEEGWSSTEETLDDTILHSEKFVLIDQQGRIRGYYNGLDPIDHALLQSDAKFLLEEGAENL